MDFAITIVLWLIVAAMAIAAANRSGMLLRGAVQQGGGEFLRLLPRIMIGVMGSGYIAAALPQDMVGRWLGDSSGLAGIAIATIAGALTPGGPVVGFALGAAALKGGAGAPQVIAYSTAWALFAFPRVFMYELPMLPVQVVWLRVVASLPVPFLAAYAAMLIGKP
jgi:hypothetical protein